jgi:hypothetical protein
LVFFTARVVVLAQFAFECRPFAFVLRLQQHSSSVCARAHTHRTCLLRSLTTAILARCSATVSRAPFVVVCAL